MKLGDIKIDKRYHKFIRAVCPDCGKERWVELRNGRLRNIYCDDCGQIRKGNSSIILYPHRSLKEAYIQDYGKNLENHFDVAENVIYPDRIFCMDCPHHCSSNWESCPIRAEALGTIKEER